MLKRPPRSGSASVLTLTTKYRPAFDRATFSNSGATMRQGPHHGAQKSTMTGSGDPLTSASKAVVVGASAGSPGGGSVALQPPHRVSLAP
jgi:hypothetical protein